MGDELFRLPDDGFRIPPGVDPFAPLAPDDGTWAEVRDVRLDPDRRDRAWVNGARWRVVGAWQTTEFFVAGGGRTRYRVWQWPGEPWRAERVEDDLEGVTGLPRTAPAPHSTDEAAWVRGANALGREVR